MLRREDPLLKAGVIMMALAVGLVVVAVIVSVALRGGAELAFASGKKSATKGSSGGEETLGYGSSYGADGQLASGPPPSSHPHSQPRSAPKPVGDSQPSEANPAADPQPKAAHPEPASNAHESKPEQQSLPAEEGTGWAAPTKQELEQANAPRHYGGLPAGAIMSLTIPDIGIFNAPVFNSDSYWALVNGVAHIPQTSLPWSATPQRNVYLAGHRMGYRGTWSRMIFYNLDKLKKGELVVLRDRSGKAYRYRVSQTFIVEPDESWVMAQVRGRDMVTLQTCTPIPTFEKRLIVRADRV